MFVHLPDLERFVEPALFLAISVLSYLVTLVNHTSCTWPIGL